MSSSITVVLAAKAYDVVLNNAGASLHRDSIDIRIVQEVGRLRGQEIEMFLLLW